MSLIEQVRRDHDLAQVIAQAGITVEPKPLDLPQRPGYVWSPIQTAAGGTVTWALSREYNPDLPGTRETPIPFDDGMTVLQNYHYIRDGVMKLWFGQQNQQPGWENENFLSADEVCL